MTARCDGHTEGDRLRTTVPAVHCEMTKTNEKKNKQQQYGENQCPAHIIAV